MKKISPLKVLVVEDDSDSLRLTKKILEYAGHTVVSAINGTDAIRIAAKEPFSFILIDINLPGMSGLEAAKRIRQAGINKDSLIIAMTSYEMPGDIKRISKAGCNGYFEKPIDPMDILQEIQKITKARK